MNLNIEYTAEQQAAIDAAIAETKNTHDGFVTYAWSDRIVQRGPQMFAIFGSMARELLRFSESGDERAKYEYVPVIVGGRMLEECPDEGRSGMLYLLRCVWRAAPHNRGLIGVWSCTYMNTGWLHTEELALTNGEIEDRLVEEIMDGKNVLATQPAGWV